MDDQGSGQPTGRAVEPVHLWWRRATGTAGARVNALSYLPKWLLLGGIVGVIAGLGAILFYTALQDATHFFLGVLAGYTPPSPAGEGNSTGTGHYVRAWAIPLVVILGGLLAGFTVFTWAPEAEGHGTDAAIDAVHHNPRQIRLRAVVVKIIASALTIGSGGSGGREGPTAQISAGFGSLLARVLNLSPEDGRIAVSIGIGSGIGAIFGAPLGGAVLAAEIVYSDDFEYEALLPGVLASVVAWAVFGAAYGYRSMFDFPGGYHFEHPIQLLWFALIGLLAGGIGLLYSKGFYGVTALSARLPFTRKLRPALGAAIVGLLALWLPEVLGTGYGWVQESLSGQLLHTPLYIILLLPFARIAATAFSIGTGGSGGVFGPGMVIGAFTGLAVWRVLEPIAPSVGHNPAPFVVVGMMAVFGSISRAPVAVMLMVAEMTGSLAMLAPAMAAVVVSWFIVERAGDSIYRSQLRSRADSAASRLAEGLPSLSTLRVSQAMSQPRVVIDEHATAAEALDLLRRSGLPGAPVADADGNYLGTVGTARLAEQAAGGADMSTLTDATAASVTASASLDVGLRALMDAGGQWLTVTSADRRVVGILSVADLARGYQLALGSSAGALAQASSDSVAMEVTVDGDSPLGGRAIRNSSLPAGSVVVAIKRGDQNLPVTASTVLEEGDVLSLFARPDRLSEIGALVCGQVQPSTPERRREARAPGGLDDAAQG